MKNIRLNLIFSFVLFLFVSFIELQAEPKQTICLNMIVKNENEVICRCLESVKGLIDYWVIVDTGSTDQTQRIIQEYMQDIPGELHQKPWVDFAFNRNEALQLAKGKADYVLIIDADEVLQFDKNFQKPLLTKDFYYIQTNYSNLVYNRTQLINNKLDWKWAGVVHEAIDCKQACTHDTLLNVINFVRTDGARSKDSQKYQKDAQLFEKALLEDPTNQRSVFYLAQSYRDAEMHEKAIKIYQRRISMGGWDQEIFWSLLQIGVIQERMKMPVETIINSYQQAYAYRPSRIEPLYQLAHLYRRSENYAAGYQAASQGLALPFITDILFVEKWIYDYGLLLEFSICAYWVEHYKESFLASQLLLANPLITKEVRECVETNLKWINQKLNESKKTSFVSNS
jgi:glycosyltransferase involved in cell wall biosynthesis